MVGVPVETYDERFTTVTAERALAEIGVRGAARRQVVDKVAAAVILQSWLDARRPGSGCAVTIADDLARERAARRGAERDVDEARGIDDLDSLEHARDARLEHRPVGRRRGRRHGRAAALADPLGEVGGLHAARPRDRR